MYNNKASDISATASHSLTIIFMNLLELNSMDEQVTYIRLHGRRRRRLPENTSTGLGLSSRWCRRGRFLGGIAGPRLKLCLLFRRCLRVVKRGFFGRRGVDEDAGGRRAGGRCRATVERRSCSRSNSEAIEECLEFIKRSNSGHRLS